MFRSLVFVGFLLSCTASISPFRSQQTIAKLEDNRLIEASGIETSHRNLGMLWGHNDSGHEPSLFLLDTLGEIKMEVLLEGVKNIDWEDISTSVENGKIYIYIADFGDNKAVRESVQILRIAEPIWSDTDFLSIPREEIEIMHLRYDEGARDAESLLFDVKVNELVIVSKRDTKARIYSFPFVPNDSPTLVKHLGKLPESGFTAADSNSEGEILIKNYEEIFYFPSDNRTIAEALLAWKPVSVNYIAEPQGEAICWFGADFLTLSEKRSRKQKLLRFDRKH
ncbi:MAG: hypothetical protein AAF789_13255 [Bacteroidota bacterium]